MKKTFWIALALISSASAASAQKPTAPARDLRRDPAPATATAPALAAPTQVAPTQMAPSTATTRPSTLSQTPEMWFYEQERSRYEDPKAAVRRIAEQKASERSARLASLKWFGMSNSRPMVSTVPYFGTYSPMWTAPGFDPNRWRAYGPTTVVSRPVPGPY